MTGGRLLGLVLCALWALCAPALAADPLPPAPEGVAELELAELLAPIGRKGLEYGPRAKALDGQRVRVLGYMVERDRPTPGRFLFTRRPVRLHEAEYGQADELPAATLLVVAPAADAERVLPYTPGPMLLTGRLELGAAQDVDGRAYSARLVLDPPEPERRSSP